MHTQLFLCTIDANSSLFLSADSDFIYLSESLTFFPGETLGTTRCLSITILDNDLVECNEVFAVTISSTGAVQGIENTTTNVTISDTDCKAPHYIVVSNTECKCKYEPVLPTVITVGLQSKNLTVRENETFPVCVEITAGSLDCEAYIGLEVQNSSTKG